MFACLYLDTHGIRWLSSIIYSSFILPLYFKENFITGSQITMQLINLNKYLQTNKQTNKHLPKSYLPKMSHDASASS